VSPGRALYAAGTPVPYPAQALDTELLLLEFIGSAGGIAAPRLGNTLPLGRAPLSLNSGAVTVGLVGQSGKEMESVGATGLEAGGPRSDSAGWARGAWARVG
jgi:hypothetical protein